MTTFVPALAALTAAVAGPVLEPTDPGYAEEVSGFNAAYLPSPAVVVGATCAADVAAAVRHAAATGRRIAVQATGHGLLGDLNGTVLVSTRRMTALTIDPDARTARVGAGVRWREVIDAAAPHGLAPLNGSASGVGVVGYTTGGGLGPMARRYGFAADHVTALTIVTADGEIRDVDAQSDPDLFWAVRGGKGNLGIVTSIEFALMPVTRFYGGGIFFAGESAPAVLHAWREWAPTLPEDATTSVALLALPPDPNLPPPLQGRFVAHLRFTHLGSATDGAALLAPMRAVAEPVMDLVDEMPYPAIDAVHMDPTDPMPVWDRGAALAELPAEAVDAILAEAGPESSSPLVLVELRLLGGAIARRPEVPNAVSGRDAAFSVYCLGVTAGPDAAVQVPARAASLVDALAPWSTRGLVNLLGQASADRVGALWSDDDRARLLEIKQRVDPAGVFGTNVVIG
ncbi:FAD/FMN-containing dehydrogenase [Pseudonocardia sediminis]|uniref:FAD/FMN-containing dehydrogenase n=1 Tax=Pseudonocardia sediminis TaxID=1397368 RepID=A0A4Q7UQ39_PSEST|nr:FAD-binding oxidoreductase [Pseudonocardia sediminis]RZT83887.1 FAD/FMN-containing dehydrogenase [Pseudonocardia sediminis]